MATRRYVLSTVRRLVPMLRLLAVPLLLALLPASALAQPAAGDVVFNEIMYDPPAPQPSGNEWVELYNTSDASVDLVEFTLADANDNPVPVTDVSTPLGAGEYAVLVDSGEDFAAAYPGVPFIEVDGFPALNNGGDTITLRYVGGGANTVIDQVPYDDEWGGADASLESGDVHQSV